MLAWTGAGVATAGWLGITSAGIGAETAVGVTGVGAAITGEAATGTAVTGVAGAGAVAWAWAAAWIAAWAACRVYSSFISCNSNCISSISSYCSIAICFNSKSAWSWAILAARTGSIAAITGETGVAGIAGVAAIAYRETAPPWASPFWPPNIPRPPIAPGWPKPPFSSPIYVVFIPYDEANFWFTAA